MKIILNNPTNENIVKWQKLIYDEDFETIYNLLQNLNPFTKDNEHADIDSSDLAAFMEAFYTLLFTPSNIERKRIRGLCHYIFKFLDIIYLCIHGLNDRISKNMTDLAKWNLYWFMRFIPLPNKRIYPFYKDIYEIIPIEINALNQPIQNIWLKLTKIEIPLKLCRVLVPYFVDNVIDSLPNAELFGDFLFSVFNKGQLYSVLSLAGIFKLIVNRNFEYPDFYSQVYSLVHPSVCYSSYGNKFFELLYLILSSTHVPAYILFSFIKKLSIILLQAPCHQQFPLLTLIRNLITCHTVLLPLIHRDNPKTLLSDPYNTDSELNQKSANCLDSSLWELKLIRTHWYDRVSKKVDFLDRNAQENEAFIKWRSSDELFDEIMDRKIRNGAVEILSNDNEIDEDNHTPKKKKKVTFIELGSESSHIDKENILPMKYIKPSSVFLSHASTSLWKI